MDRAVERYFSAGLAAATRKTYQAGQKHYLTFCRQSGISPVPATEDTLCRFAAVLASKGIAHSTVKVYLSATHQLHIEKGLPDPGIENMAKLSQVLRGIRSTQSGKSNFVRRPITPGMLVQIKNAWEEEGPDDNKLMLWAAMLLCFFGFFRSGEICAPPPGCFDSHAHLTFADVSVDSFSNPQQLHVHLKRSKTDQMGKGTLICIGRTGEQLCPVTAVLACMDGAQRQFWRASVSLQRWDATNTAAIRGRVSKVAWLDWRGSEKVWWTQLQIGGGDGSGSAGYRRRHN